MYTINNVLGLLQCSKPTLLKYRRIAWLHCDAYAESVMRRCDSAQTRALDYLQSQSAIEEKINTIPSQWQKCFRGKLHRKHLSGLRYPDAPPFPQIEVSILLGMSALFEVYSEPQVILYIQKYPQFWEKELVA